MVGAAVIPEFEMSGATVVATDIRPGWRKLDVRRSDEVRRAVAEVAPNLILHLAAETDLEVCERERQHCWSTNAEAVSQVAKIASSADIPLVYVSTAGVFDGMKHGPYVESDQPSPVNQYGRSKLAGERAVVATCRRYFILRAGWMIGGGRVDHKFVGLILGQVAAGAQEINAVGDKWGSPTYNFDFARCVRALVKTEAYGIYHVASGGQPSRFEVAAHILDQLNRTDITLVKVESSYFSDRYPCRRPRSEWLQNAELERLGINLMRPWTEALDEYLTAEFSHLVRK
jgi:dTDP-4-dehydrorhamnose reductase